MSRAAFKIGSKVRELRIHLCQKGNTSQGVRDYIKNHYVELKSNNSRFPILVRECSGVQPKLWVRYEFGEEKCFPLTNKSVEEIADTVKRAAQ